MRLCNPYFRIVSLHHINLLPVKAVKILIIAAIVVSDKPGVVSYFLFRFGRQFFELLA
jgi:hypothetical protein